MRGHHAVALASAEPEAPLFIDVANVAHAVQGFAGDRVVDFRERGGFGIAEIARRDDGPAHDELADDTGWTNIVGAPLVGALHRMLGGAWARVGHFRFGGRVGTRIRAPTRGAPTEIDRLIRNPHHYHLNPRHRLPDADPTSLFRQRPRLIQNLRARNVRHRQALGRAVGGEDRHARREQLRELLQHGRGRGGAGADDPADAGIVRRIGAGFVRQSLQHGRGSEQIGAAEPAELAADFRRVDVRGAAGVHLRDDTGHAEGGAEQREQREGAEVDFAGLDAVGRLQ